MTGRDELLELAALDAAGALTPSEQAALTGALSAADDATRRAVTALYEAAAGVVHVHDAAPSPGVRERIMAHAARSASFRFVDAGEGWMPHEIPGARFKLLSVDEGSGRATLVLEVPAGTTYPSHHHSGPEDCYVIEGDVEVEGRRLGAGDFHHAAAGSTHQPLRSAGGATVLLVVAAADYLR